MVHTCIIPSSNMYEEPRPPRRGSHRPAPLSYPSLNEWPEERRLLVYQKHVPSRFDLLRSSVPIPVVVQGQRGYYWPEEEMVWKQGTILPTRRPVPMTNARVLAMRRPSIAVGGHEETSIILSREQSPVTNDKSPVPKRVGRDDTRVRPSLELLRQFNGRVPDRQTLERSILESYARSAPQSAACQTSQKRCIYPDCTKISVSRGLCRGHGGGRRCHVPGCTKSAQSRSNFCWAHGGGQRCDVDGCMRSRKSKHYCVAHLKLEGQSPTKSPSPDHGVPVNKPNASRAASRPIRALPSLGQALSTASRSAPNLPVRNKSSVSV